MTSAFIRRDLMGPYPPGVPNPQTWHVHPYPTRFHGGIWTREVFGFPVAEQAQSVFIPGRDVSGLGALYDTGRGIFKPGGYGGGVFDGNLSGLGGNEATYPWGQYSAETKKLQEATNTALQQYGYCPITADGKLGPATCGARAQLVIDTLKKGDTRTLFMIPDACPSDAKQMTAPRAASGGCGGSKPAAPVSAPLPPVPTSMSAGMSASSKKALAATVGAVAAMAIVYALKKKSGARGSR